MGQNFFLQWFNRPVNELKAILETEKLTDEQKKEIEKEIKRQELQCE